MVGRGFPSLLAVLFLWAVSGQAPAQLLPEPPPPAEEAPAQPESEPVVEPTQDLSVIPAAQIAEEAMRLDERLRDLPDRLAPEATLDEIAREVDRLSAKITEKTRTTEAAIQAHAVFAELREAEFDWRFLANQLAAVADRLTEQATLVEGVAELLRISAERWSRTSDTLREEESPPELVEMAAKAVAEIGAAQNLVEGQRARIAGLQLSLAGQAESVSDELDSITKAIEQSRASLLKRDSAQLWDVQFQTRPRESLASQLRRPYMDDLARTSNFIRAKRDVLIGILFLTLAAWVVFVRLARWAKADAEVVFRRSASLALLVGLVATIPLLYDAPQGVKGLVDLLGVWIVVRLLLPRLTPPFRKMLLALMASILTWEVIKLFQFPVWIERDLLLVFGVSFAALLWWLSREARRSEVPLTRPQRVVLMGVRVALFLIVVSVLANIAGYHGLADLLVRGTLVSAYRAVTLYTVVVVGSAIASWALHARATRRLSAFNTDVSRLVHRVSITLGAVIFGVWLHTALNLFTIRESVYAAIRAALTYRIAIGSVGFSLSNVVAFALTLFVGYLLAAVLRIILGEEVLPRLKLGRGLPLAIATVTHYVVLFLIFLLALAAAGVELSKFTLLTGALGVGLGFGLQNVVNNFVSGLILLFERPVRVGDLLEIGGISGEVTKLGFRSSTLHAFDGSDLIIPNADLISQKVVNWTFSGTLRQILLKVDVAHGSDPRRVRDLLYETVIKEPGVLEHPKAHVLFLGHGDTAIHFEVRFWAARPEEVAELRSDVALSISAALADAGIKMPKRDLHIRGMEPATGAKEPVIPQGH